jgi:hypothetical protein
MRLSNIRTRDDFVPGGYQGSSDTTGITVDAAGNVYVSGLSDVLGKQAWTIRKGVGGTSFSTVDLMTGSYPMAIFAHPTGGIFAAGRKSVTIKGKTSTAWVVRRSADGGATWSDADTFQLSSSLYSTALGIGADALGNLYVVGRGVTGSGINTSAHWLVRKSTNGGNSWSTVDDFQQNGSNVEARRFAATSSGDLYVAGMATSSAGRHWIVRKSAGGTGPWSTIDDYQYVSGTSTEPHAMAADASGNLFVGGGGGVHWLVKRY